MSVTAVVNREFVGQARELRRVLAADDIVAYQQMGKFTLPFVPVRSGLVPRPELLARAAAGWREKIPTTGRLQLEVDLRRKSLNLRELRVLAADGRFSEWAPDDSEPGFSLVALQLEVNPPRFQFDPVTLAGVSLHAVSRWFQRSFRNTRDGLLRDLRILALSVDDARLEAGGEFEVQAGDGRWVGVIMKLEGETPQRILAARSFLTH